MSDLTITNHFIARYAERILGQIPPNKIFPGFKYGVMKDLSSRIIDKELNFIELFKENTGTIKIPFNKTHEIVMENKTLITIY